MENLFFTTTVHVQTKPLSVFKGDVVSLHEHREAIEKVHRFCHEIHHMPITWICTWHGLEQHADLLKEYCLNWGDEVGILEFGVYTARSLAEDTEPTQSWVEEGGFLRPDHFTSKEPQIAPVRAWHDMSYEEQKPMIAYLKKAFEEKLGGIPVTTFASPYVNGGTVRSCRELGLTCMWGIGHEGEGEGINHRGAPFGSFYPSDEDLRRPLRRPVEDGDPLTLNWGPSPMAAGGYQALSRGDSGWCLNPMEEANRSFGTDQWNLTEKVLNMDAEQAKWNQYALIQLQNEAEWMGEKNPLPGFYDPFPEFGGRAMEVFFHQIEYCLRIGAKPMTHRQFTQWHRTHVGIGEERIGYYEDVVPELEARGKDQPYQPFVIYNNGDCHYRFCKKDGMNFICNFDYTHPIELDRGSVKGRLMPQVKLHAKHQHMLQPGIHLTQEHAEYAIPDFVLTARDECSGYAGAIWKSNVPSYIKDEDLELGGALKRVRTVREKNLMLIFADLKEGDNLLEISSSLPNRYIRIERIDKVHRRYEIYIRNDGERVEIASLQVVLEPGLALDGFWWDGMHYRTLNALGPSGYDYTTGLLTINAEYPLTYPAHHGLTRISIELM